MRLPKFVVFGEPSPFGDDTWFGLNSQQFPGERGVERWSGFMMSQ